MLEKLNERKRRTILDGKLQTGLRDKPLNMAYDILLERLGRQLAKNMVNKVKDGQLRHRIYQASFR
ncbi:MAG: hypothetical protein QFX33_03340 [Candidatus Nezhaarchaeota archaeon]|nr:hypothetical protein [Candidatus Nezhaarchaeota archaeon]